MSSLSYHQKFDGTAPAGDATVDQREQRADDGVYCGQQNFVQKPRSSNGTQSEGMGPKLVVQ